ncbi:hypothetical protein HG536_0A07510 [Torulaspora globosa]|uniref:PHD-type domain-containing protein n=1 Tax=Torulaspora globosa TaxID=48254 RepID=A0A7G3ZBQ0_9SACH|nr:uncharacterized protein HG536_0A07510 [Torulaspora globosa]QLL30936.1 hypothetical protein HG536_0A07510 [Torulaspora globosa]
MSLPEWCPPYTARKKSPISGEEVYCICKKTDSGELMVGCDGCDDWFHFSCLRIPEKYKELVFSFYCPYCQAGITGPSSRAAAGQVEERRTIWKRKCRLSGCFKPCRDASKYCCEEHGEQYMKQALERLQVKGHTRSEQELLVKQMLGCLGGSSQDFQAFGQHPFADEEAVRQGDPSLYDRIVCEDQRLQELQNNQKELQEQTIPNISSTLESLRTYRQWLDDVNSKLLAAKGDSLARDKEGGRQRKKTSGKKQKKTICGYCAHWEAVPCAADEIVAQFDGTTSTIRGVCTKLNCNKHADWSSIAAEQLTNQLRSLQAHQDRLRLLISTRKEQLMIQFYERSLLHKN